MKSGRCTVEIDDIETTTGLHCVVALCAEKGWLMAEIKVDKGYFLLKNESIIFRSRQDQKCQYFKS